MLYALAGSLIFGILAQGMGLFNKYSWHDDIFSLFGTGATITSGRWMLFVVSELEILIFGNGHFSTPLVNGLFSLLCIGLSAGLTVRLVRIRSRMLCFLLGGFLAVFPVITALFGFMFALPYYMLALLMMTAGGTLICEKGSWWKKLSGVLLSGCSIGIYQAFLPMLPALILLYDLEQLAGSEEKDCFLRHAAVQMLCVLGAAGVYFAGNRVFLALYDFQMDSYMSLDQAGTVSLSEYAGRMGRAYGEFLNPGRNVLSDMYPQHLHDVYLAMLALTGLLAVIHLWNLFGKKPKKAGWSCVLLLLFPVACNFIFVMSSEVHSLMVYGQVMEAVLLAWLANRMGSPSSRGRRLAVRMTALGLALSCAMYIRYDNQCYLKTAFQQQEAISWNTALVTRIKSVKGYRDELPVAWVNRVRSEDRTLYRMEELEGITLASYEQDLQGYLNNWAWEEFLARWCGFKPETVNPANVQEWPEVREMPPYPEEGSIQIVNDIVIVRF